MKAGAERFTTTYTGGNSQTATGYVFYSNYLVDAAGRPQFNADGTLTPRFIPGSSMLYNWLPTRGATMDIHTTSLYAQDRWAASRHLSFDLGVRYERVRNDATGDVVSAKTDTFLPRLAATYDLRGDGQWIAQATYGHYAGRYSEAQFTGNSNVANPSLIVSVYTGPAGEGLGFAPGLNPANYTVPVAGNFPTANVSFADGLSSARNAEWTASLGGELGARGYAKATFVHRRTTDIIDDVILRELGATTVSRGGIVVGTYDNVQFRNAGNALFRNYQAMVLQGRYSPTSTWSIAGHWTLQIRNHGNTEGEVAGRPGAPSPFGDYPEAFAAARHYPEGRLDDFQRHKVRAWTTYGLDLGRFGTLDSSVIYRFNSAQTYSLAATGQPLSAVQLARNPGYARASGQAQTIFYDERGSESFNASNQVDLGVLYQLPLWKSLRPWLKIEYYNVFNNQALVFFNTAVTPDATSSLDANGLRTGFVRGSNFGTARSNADFPRATNTPGGSALYARTFLMSFGFRF